MPELPAPRPRFELFVYSPRLEARAPAVRVVARGGLRWSDRREDFRTEVLGLVKAQEVKNSVIVPSGAKGGFVCKDLPDPADREAYQREVMACYQTFIRGDAGHDRQPRGRPGGAAARGGQARRRRPLPGGGGGQGHGHVLGHGQRDREGLRVLARRRVRLRRVGRVRPQGDGHHRPRRVGVGQVPLPRRSAWTPAATTSPSSGIGDMSGDVFGNGMLLSEHIRLVAAFDHRHIFLDPDPDPAASFAERRAAVRPAPLLLGGLRRRR